MTAKLTQKINFLLFAKSYASILSNFSNKISPWCQQPVLLGSLIVTSLLLGIRQTETLQPLELMEFDRALQFIPHNQPDRRILVVEITEADISNQKRWPLSDATIAKLLAKLQSDRAKTIGLDIHRDVQQPPGQAALLKQLQAPNVISIYKLGDGNDSAGVKPPDGVPKEQIGFNDFVLDPDGVIRRTLMYASENKNQKKYYSFSLQVSLAYLKERQISLQITPNYLQIGKTTFLPLETDSGGYQDIDNQGYQVLLNYRGKEVAKTVTLTDVLNGKVNPDWIKDKIVLIGTTAPSQKDIFFTPYNGLDRQKAFLPGVIVHAQMVSQIISAVLDDRPLFWFWPQWLEKLWVWGWSLVGGILVWRFRHPISLGISGMIAIGGLFAVWLICFTQAGWIPLIVPALGLVATGATVGSYKLFYDTFYDILTGLPNRDLFLKKLANSVGRRCRENERSKSEDNSLFAVIFLDLDRFKVINETFGHSLGDEMLIAVAQRLNAHLRPTDTLARIGGDEFAILLENITNLEMATVILDRLQQALSLPFNLKGQEIFTSASFGIAFNQAKHHYKPEEFLRDAHTAMYRAKSLGKARYEVFATGMRSQVLSRLQLENNLRRAIASTIGGNNREFSVYYQPIVSLNTKKIAGFEALVRWQNPEGKFISPGDFIPVAEETGLIIPLGEWILQESCRQLRSWQETFGQKLALTLSVNISSQQFCQPDLTERIERIIKETGIDQHTLKLEITESMAMQDVESTIATILRLKSLNLRFSIDDFGTGYSSLSYLHRFPVDTLKVDRSFVSRMEDTAENAAIVQTIVMLGHSLGMDVVAEGVETASQMDNLRALECEYGQGYFFSRPLNAEAATDFLCRIEE